MMEAILIIILKIVTFPLIPLVALVAKGQEDPDNPVSYWWCLKECFKSWQEM